MAKTIAAPATRKALQSLPGRLPGRGAKRRGKALSAVREEPDDEPQKARKKGRKGRQNGKRAGTGAKKLLGGREQPDLTPETGKSAQNRPKNAGNTRKNRKSVRKPAKSALARRGWGKAGERPASGPPREARKSGQVSAPLLAWYDRHRRVLPWRALPGEVPDPYKVWLSEIMLQQTTVAAVGPYFQRFVARWPTVVDLAATPIEDLLAAWAGLGYYARARNLHACALAIVRDHGGVFPDTEDGLRRLPGIGAYTAGAIAAIAFDRRAAAVDGNVERVTARLFAVREPLPVAKPRLRALAAGLVPDRRAGDFAQAMMDLGATICTPRKPACGICPLQAMCQARRLGLAESLPVPAAKKARPTRRALAFWIEREGEGGEIEVLLRRRPPQGLLGGMLEIPGSDWQSDAAAADESVRAQAPVRATSWQVLPGIVRHGFTHFELETVVLAARVAEGTPAPTAAQWWPRRRLDAAGLPTVMWKVVKHVAERG